MNAFDTVHDIFSTYNETCTISGDCATLADAIRRKLESIKRIQMTEATIETLSKRIRNGDIIIMRVPTIFAHFHYLTMVYEHKRLFVFQHFGSYRIPITVHDISFIHRIQEYIRIIQQDKPSDEEIGQLLDYEQTLYGITTVQINELLDAQFLTELYHIEDRCKQYDPPHKIIRDSIKTILQSLPSWTDQMILSSYCQSEPHVSLTQWLEEYSYAIVLQVIPLLVLELKKKIQIDREEIHNYILEKLTITMSDLYADQGRDKIQLHIVHILFYKNTMDQKDTTEIIRYHMKRPTVSSTYKSRHKYKK